tara:strand:- start:47 stop:1009 length:963 start_codon:yes stop_codon:yes gene_type:complete
MKNYPIFTSSLLISIVVLFFSIFFTTPKYKTESIIYMQEPEAGLSLSAGGFVSDLLGSSSFQSLNQLKEYFESESGAKELENFVDVETYFRSKEIDFISRFKPGFLNMKFSTYIKRNILKINILEESGSVRITTYGFSQDQSFRLNIVSLLMASNYFDRKQQLNSEITKVQKLCELYANSKNINLDEFGSKQIELIDENEVKEINSGYELLSKKASKYLEFCKISSVEGGKDNLKEFPLPTSTLKEINAESLKRAISKIFNSSVSSVTMADNLSIITEPVFPTEIESKNSLIKSLVTFFFSLMILSTVKIIFNLRKDLTP